MKFGRLGACVAIAGCLAIAACVPIVSRPVARSPMTRAEATEFRETSRYSDVVSFLDSLTGRPITFGSIGNTNEGRKIPFVIASYPRVRTPTDARALRRPIVYVQANIHAGEVEGKDALLALVRDLTAAPRPNVLDSIVLIAVPIYNADGNERVAPQRINRTEQDGPEIVGSRANAQGLDLNRDYIKSEAPETRASLAMWAAWEPDVFVDLHTTDGSYHGYSLTYAPSLNPAAPLGFYTRDSLMPVLRARMQSRHGFATFDYGNFVSEDTLSRGWETFDSRPRFGTNYFGLRGGIAILSEAYSHDPFKRRVASTYAFVREILSLVAERGIRITALARAGNENRMLPLRSGITASPDSQDVIAEKLDRIGDTARTAAGVRAGYRRTGKFSAVRMPIFDRFVAVVSRPLPYAYLIGRGDTVIVRLLRGHGVRVDSLASPPAGNIQSFTIDSVIKSAQLFQGHYETRIAGRWKQRGGSGAAQSIAAGMFIVFTKQKRGMLAGYLLEPDSEDGFVTWNFYDPRLGVGGEYPVWRVESIVSGVLNAP